MDIVSLLVQMQERGASDLHLKVGNHPVMRINGTLVPLVDLPIFDPATVRDLVESMMNDDQQQRFSADLELDFAYSVPKVGRFQIGRASCRERV